MCPVMVSACITWLLLAHSVHATCMGNATSCKGPSFSEILMVQRHVESLAPNAKTLEKGNSSPSNLPTNGKVAIIFRGATFHGAHLSEDDCGVSQVSEPCYGWMMSSIISAKTKLVTPLKSRGNSVEIFFSECYVTKSCDKTPDLLEALADRTGAGVTAKQQMHSSSQADCMRGSLEWFEKQAGSTETYDLILITRPDIWLIKPIDEWPTADFSGFNFFGGCQPGAFADVWNAEGSKACVVDILQAMPGRLFPKWQNIVGKGNCFHVEEEDPRGHGPSHGHWCYNQTVDSMGSKNVHLMTDYRPENNARQAYDIGQLTTCR